MKLVRVNHMSIMERYLQIFERHDVDMAFRVFERSFVRYLNEFLIAFEQDDLVNLNFKYL